MNEVNDLLASPLVTNSIETLNITPEEFRQLIVAKCKEVGYIKEVKKSRQQFKAVYIDDMGKQLNEFYKSKEPKSPYGKIFAGKIRILNRRKHMLESVFERIYGQTLRVLSRRKIGKDWTLFCEAVLIVLAEKLGLITTTDEQQLWVQRVYSAQAIIAIGEYWNDPRLTTARIAEYGESVADIVKTLTEQGKVNV